MLVPSPAPAQGLPTALPGSVGMSAPALARIDSLMAEYVAAGRLAGAVTLVARDGRIVHHAAHGVRDLATGAPMTTDAIFRVASHTKAVATVAMLRLTLDRELRLFAPVSDHLPEFAGTVVGVASGDSLVVEPARRPITIHDLLTHRSGISYGMEPHLADLYEEAGLRGWYFADRDLPMHRLIRRLPELPFAEHPGERFIYGLGTDVVGAIIERVTGAPLDAYLREHVLEPLGMPDTHFYLPPDDVHRLAAVHALGADGRVARAPESGAAGQGEYVDGPRTAFSAGAGLLTTAADYARFLQMLLNGGELDGRRILPEPVVEAMLRDQSRGAYVAPGYGFGLGFEIKLEPGGPDGWDVPGLASVGSFGWGGAYHTTYWVDPRERLIGIFLTQLIPATGSDAREAFRTAVYEALESRNP